MRATASVTEAMVTSGQVFCALAADGRARSTASGPPAKTMPFPKPVMNLLELVTPVKALSRA